MGLPRWAAELWAKRWLKRAEQGKEGDAVKNGIQWARAHKRELTGIAAAVVAYLYATGNEDAMAFALPVMTFLAGAGFIDSDKVVKGKQ